MRRVVLALGLCGMLAGAVHAQTRRTRPAAAGRAPVKEAAKMACPSLLGTGVNTQMTFCDVLTGRDPAAGVVITLPPHQGDVKLTFNLHNRHTYSEEQMKDKRVAFARYTASIGALTADNTLISRAAIQSEFRTAADLFDRIEGGAGPSGLKAVAPIGSEPIVLTIPAAETTVSILGEKLIVERADGNANYTSTGRPIAIISDVMVEYRPAPASRTSRPATRPPAPGN